MCLSDTDKVIILMCIRIQHEWRDLYRDGIQHEGIYVVLNRTVAMVFWRIQGLNLSVCTVSHKSNCNMTVTYLVPVKNPVFDKRENIIKLEGK